MNPGSLENRPFEKEFIINTSRSGGPGGQHVNKTETRVELRFHIDSSAFLTDEEKDLLKAKQKKRINKDGFLQIFAQEYRSQKKNKELVEKRFYYYLRNALKKQRRRIATKPSKQGVEKRLRAKKKQAEKKALRSKIDYNRRG